MNRSETTTEGQKKKQHNGLQQSVQERQQDYARKGLKEKKKEFLKNRKLKKKGARHGEEDDLEAQLAQDPHKPKFGEQAMAPIKVWNNWRNLDQCTIQSVVILSFPAQCSFPRALVCGRSYTLSLTPFCANLEVPVV